MGGGGGPHRPEGEGGEQRVVAVAAGIPVLAFFMLAAVAVAVVSRSTKLNLL